MIDQTLNQRYRVAAELGRGAMGEVYRTIDLQTGQEVALKVIAGQLGLQAEGLERFQREGEALRQLRHRNIVAFVDMFAEQGRQVIVMEYVAGGNLHHLIRQGALPVARAREIALDLCDALICAHRLAIVHRDIKPENVLLHPDGTPKLTDFGVARLLSAGTRLTGTGTQIGTPYYMSPEAWEGKPLDAQSDVWSLGVVLYEMLTGQVPFGGDTMVAVMTKVLNAPLPDMAKLRPEVPPALRQVVARALTRDKSRRYASVRQMSAELELCTLPAPGKAHAAIRAPNLAGSPASIAPVKRETSPNPPGVKTRGTPGQRRSLLLGAVVVVIATCLLAIGGIGVLAAAKLFAIPLASPTPTASATASFTPLPPSATLMPTLASTPVPPLPTATKTLPPPTATSEPALTETSPVSGACAAKPPTLQMPADEAQLDTLTPTFLWKAGSDPGATDTEIQISQAADFAQLSPVSLGRFEPGDGNTVWRLNKLNAEPNTRYYWRGRRNCGQINGAFGPTWSFTTGSGGVILPAPKLLSPATGSTTGSVDVVLQWQAVSGAQSYMFFYRIGGSTWYPDAATTQLNLTGLTPHATYYWWVLAINNYANGAESDVRTFKTP